MPDGASLIFSNRGTFFEDYRPIKQKTCYQNPHFFCNFALTWKQKHHFYFFENETPSIPAIHRLGSRAAALCGSETRHQPHASRHRPWRRERQRRTCGAAPCGLLTVLWQNHARQRRHHRGASVCRRTQPGGEQERLCDPHEHLHRGKRHERGCGAGRGDPQAILALDQRGARRAHRPQRPSWGPI